jgi:hypothetical protein
VKGCNYLNYIKYKTMKKLRLNKSNFEGAEVPGRAQLKNAMRGVVPVSTDYNSCYNICMSGFVGDSKATEAKVLACDQACS